MQLDATGRPAWNGVGGFVPACPGNTIKRLAEGPTNPLPRGARCTPGQGTSVVRVCLSGLAPGTVTSGVDGLLGTIDPVELRDRFD